MYYTIKNDLYSAQINEKGAELHSWKKRRLGQEYIWQGDPCIWSGQAPVLFPIVGRLLDDKYRFGGREYTMEKHGFARNSVFTPISSSANKIVFSLKSSDATREVYPFDFELLVSFELDGSTLRSSNTVVNRGDGMMYFSVGAHPGFNCAMGDYLRFEKLETIGTEKIDENSINMGETAPLLDYEDTITITPELFLGDALILNGLKSETVTLGSPDNGDRLLFRLGRAPFLGIWAKPGAPYVCIEPWYGVNDGSTYKDDISQKRGIVALKPFGVFLQEWSVTALR